MKRVLRALIALVLLLETGCTRSVVDIGVLRQKTLSEVHNDLIIGCETLDRGYADYHAYKEYLEPLGMRYIRLQAGWAKCEPKRGEYDFFWLDSIIDDAVSRGLEPWLELSYGNPVYPGGGTPLLSGGWPRGKDALEGWKAWVRALATRYKGKVHQWEIWNEPENNMRREGRNPAEMASLAFETALTLKEIDPDAIVAAYGIGRPRHTNGVVELITLLADKLRATGQEHLIDAVSYHGYHYIPEDPYFVEADSLKAILAKCNWIIPVWQGESGAPSVGYMGGAISDYPWTEVSQAKWALRKILCDHAHGIRTGIFSIADMNYASTDEIKKKNYKGLLSTDDHNQVLRPKMAYDAVRNLVSVFDNLQTVCDSSAVKVYADSAMVYLFQEEVSGMHSAVLWKAGAAPKDECVKTPVKVVLNESCGRHPVCVDLLSGHVYRPNVRRCMGTTVLKNVPFFDSPVVICDESQISMAAASVVPAG